MYLIVSQRSECINDHARNHTEANSKNNCVERHVVDQFQCICGEILVTFGRIAESL